MARLYQKINNEAVPLGGGGGGSVAIDNVTITENSDDEIQVATTLIDKINQLNNVAADMGKVLTANGDGTAEWDDVLVPIDYETITKNSDGELQVSSMPYDNTESGLTADNVQDAIDELANAVNTKPGVNVIGKWTEGGVEYDLKRAVFSYGTVGTYTSTGGYNPFTHGIPNFNPKGIRGLTMLLDRADDTVILPTWTGVVNKDWTTGTFTETDFVIWNMSEETFTGGRVIVDYIEI